MFNAQYAGLEHNGYVLSKLNIGGGDYIELEICLECGKLQGSWPINDATVKDIFTEE